MEILGREKINIMGGKPLYSSKFYKSCNHGSNMAHISILHVSLACHAEVNFAYFTLVSIGDDVMHSHSIKIISPVVNLLSHGY